MQPCTAAAAVAGLSLLYMLAPLAAAASLCPSSTPSPSNPVGCVLWSFPSSVAQPSAVTVDTVARPNTLIVVSNATQSVAVHFLNGTLYRQLLTPIAAETRSLALNLTFPLQPLFPNAGPAVVDSAGFVFVPAQGVGTGVVWAFSPYPQYAFTNVASTPTVVGGGGVLTTTEGEFLFLPTSGLVYM